MIKKKETVKDLKVRLDKEEKKDLNSTVAHLAKQSNGYKKEYNLFSRIKPELQEKMKAEAAPLIIEKAENLPSFNTFLNSSISNLQKAIDSYKIPKLKKETKEKRLKKVIEAVKEVICFYSNIQQSFQELEQSFKAYEYFNPLDQFEEAFKVDEGVGIYINNKFCGDPELEEDEEDFSFDDIEDEEGDFSFDDFYDLEDEKIETGAEPFVPQKFKNGKVRRLYLSKKKKVKDPEVNNFFRS